jgi:predicted Zn-dependent peptidase
MALEDTVEHMLWLGDYAASLNKLPDREEIIKKVESVTAEDLMRVSKSIFNSSGLNIAVIGDIEDREQREIEKELNL